MNLTGDWTLHFIAVLLTVGILAANHLFMHRRFERRASLDASGLRAALIAELQALRDVYRMNIDLIDEGATYLLSTRSPVLVYKHNLGRLPSVLEAPVVEYLVSLFARNEIIESLLAAHANPKGGLSYRLTPQSRLGTLKQMYAAGFDQIAWACEALKGEVPPASAARMPARLVAPQRTPILPPAMSEQTAGA
jgi:hypothetical protein